MTAPCKPLVGLLLALVSVASAGATESVDPRRALLRRGGQAFRAKQFMEAARYWHRACKLRPSAELWYRVGVALYKAGEQPKAKAALQRAVALDPDHPKASRALARLAPPEPPPPEDDGDGGPPPPPPLDRLQGVTVDADDGKAEQAWTDAHRFRKLGEYDRAVGRFVEAYQYGYARPEVDFYLGQALLEDEVLDGALVHLRRAREAVPQDQGICLLLGKAYALLGDSSEQIDALETAVRLDPGYGEAHFQLALAMDLVGDSEGVLEHSQKAIRIDPEYRDKLEDALRGGAVVGRLRDLLKASLNPKPGDPPPTEEDLDGYATRLAKLLYPGALPELKSARENRQDLASAGGKARKAKSVENLLRSRAGERSSQLDSQPEEEDSLGAGLGSDEGLSDAFEAPRAPAPARKRPAAGRAPPAGPMLAGIQFRLVREILKDLHQGKGRRAFERVPHGRRAAFKRDFLAAIRGRPALADLRARVEAALRER